MKERPIIFSGPMVRALLDGRKTQTRRLASSPLAKTERGDRLWVRENFWPWEGSASGKTAVYEADDRWIDWGSGETFIDKVEWLSPVTPSIHMPRWASRLYLNVTEVRIERLQSLDENDAIAEGIEPVGDRWRNYAGGEPFRCPELSYHSLWCSLHGRQSWDYNPLVVVLTFTVEHRELPVEEAA